MLSPQALKEWQTFHVGQFNLERLHDFKQKHLLLQLLITVNVFLKEKKNLPRPDFMLEADLLFLSKLCLIF